MQIDFKALEQALKPIAAIGQGEVTFDAGGTSITLRVLRPEEEVEAQRYAAVALESEGDASAIGYLDRFRQACLSYAIVAVGGQDFRDVDFVTTGEVLENGKPVKIAKHLAMRQLLSRWTRSALAGIGTKFHEHLTKTELAAEKDIICEPADIPAEIDRLQQRIDELKADLEKTAAIEKTRFSETFRQIEEQAQGASVPIPHDVPEQNPEPAPVPVRRAGPIIPKQAVPPPVQIQGVPQQPQQPQQPRMPARSQPDTSFIDPGDDDGMNAAMIAEHQRIAERRQRIAAGQTELGDASALVMHQQRRPPHTAAAEAEADIQALDAGAQRAQELGATPEGVPVYALPVQVLEVPGARRRPDANVINPQGATGQINPRFRPPPKV